MKRTDKVIITCAITGGIHTPSMSPYLPITPDQIAAEAAAQAGAAMIHLHARDPVTGKPDQSPGRFTEFLPRIKQQSDAILDITTGGAIGMTLEERLAPALHFQPEVASMNMGSFNFNISGAAERRTEFLQDWERPYGSEVAKFAWKITDRQMPEELISFDWPDFVPVAQSLGGDGVTVRSFADLDCAEEAKGASVDNVGAAAVDYPRGREGTCNA